MTNQVYLLWGEDTFSRDEALAEIKAGLGPEEMLAPNTSRLARGVALDELLAVCHTLPFLAPRRLVIVEGFLASFEGGARGRGEAAETKPQVEASLAALVEGLAAMPPSTVLVFLEGALRASNPLLQRLRRLAQERRFSPPRGDALSRWIQRRVEAQRGRLSPAAARRLAQAAGDDLRLLAQEIEKLLLYAGSQPISEEALDLLVAHTRQESIFSLVDAVVQGRGDQAMALLRRLEAEGAAAPYLLFMVARQFRILLRIKALSQEGEPPPAVRQRLGLAEYAFTRSWAQARRYPWERLVTVHRRLLEADLAIKTGREAGALELLIADLAFQEARGKKQEAGSRRESTPQITIVFLPPASCF